MKSLLLYYPGIVEIFQEKAVKKKLNILIDEALGKLSGETVAVAVSGGSDSLALVLLVNEWTKEHTKQVIALTVDHNLRPESRVEAEQVAAWMKAQNIQHHILTWHPPASLKRLQENARHARYELLTTWCFENNISALLTAHHGDDQLETFLQRLSHGSGLTGLLGIKPVLKLSLCTVVRPLLRASKEELHAYLAEQEHPFIQDPSNENQRFSRVLIRKNQEALTALGITRTAVQKTIERLTLCEELIEKIVEEEREKRVQFDSLGYQTVVLEGWDALSSEVRHRLLINCIRCVRPSCYPPPFKSVLALDEKIMTGTLKGTTLGGCLISIKQKRLFIVREKRKLRSNLDNSIVIKTR